MNLNDVLIDSAITGILTLGVGGNADVTLTSVQGAPDQARNADFIFTGVLTGNVNVFWPVGRNRFFSVKNATTGAFSLTIAVTGTPGTTVAVPQSQTVMLKSDGTNISPRFSALLGAVSLSSLAVTGGTTLTGGALADLLTIATDQIFTRPVVTGTRNAIVLTYATSPGAYVDGAKFSFKATAANSGATTVNINAVGVRNVFKKITTGAAVACTGNEIQNGDVVEIEYDGAQFQIISLTPPIAASAAVSLAGTDIAAFLTAAGFAGNKLLGGASSSPGYYKLPGGLIIQWGTITETGPISGSVGFTLPFNSAVYGIWISPQTNCTTPPTAVATSVAVWTFGQASTTGAINYFWMALGI